MLAMIHDWCAFLDSAIPEGQLQALRAHGHTGRPLGDAPFIERLEKNVGRVLRPRKSGP
jgi:hypothetical protein